MISLLRLQPHAPAHDMLTGPATAMMNWLTTCMQPNTTDPIEPHGLVALTYITNLRKTKTMSVNPPTHGHTVWTMPPVQDPSKQAGQSRLWTQTNQNGKKIVPARFAHTTLPTSKGHRHAWSYRASGFSRYAWIMISCKHTYTNTLTLRGHVPFFPEFPRPSQGFPRHIPRENFPGLSQTSYNYGKTFPSLKRLWEDRGKIMGKLGVHEITLH